MQYYKKKVTYAKIQILLLTLQSMNNLRATLYQQRYFLAIYLLFFTALGCALAYYAKADLHLFMSSRHNAVADCFFKHYTGLCQWLPYVVGVLLVFYRFSSSLLVLLSQAVGAIIIYFAKEFYHAYRPVRWFAEYMPDVQLVLVDGVNIHTTYSFPSGHSAAFFSMFFALSIITPDRKWQVLYCLLAILGCYSRVYLSQHFCLDIWAGSLIGIVSVMLLLVWKFPMRVNALNDYRLTIKGIRRIEQ